MKRIRLGLALFFVIVLIGGASWIRFAQAKKPAAGLALVPNANGDRVIDDPSVALAGIVATIPKATTTPEQLTGTDLISRQLLADYIDMSANGQATDERIAALADQYAGQIQSLNTVAVAQLTDMRPVSDTNDNFKAYADQFTEIYKDFAKKIQGAHPEKKDLTVLGTDFYSFAATFGQAYEDAAQKLEGVATPMSLVSTHLELINLFLSSAKAMESLSKTDKDSMTAFAGIITLSANLKQEKPLIEEIGKILTSHGV